VLTEVGDEALVMPPNPNFITINYVASHRCTVAGGEREREKSEAPNEGAA